MFLNWTTTAFILKSALGFKQGTPASNIGHAFIFGVLFSIFQVDFFKLLTTNSVYIWYNYSVFHIISTLTNEAEQKHGHKL